MFGTRTRRAPRTTVVKTRRPSLLSRMLRPQPTATATHSTTSRHRVKRTRATGPAPLSTHRRARTKPTMGSKIHGMAKRVMGTLTGNRAKKNAGTVMQKGYTPTSRRRRHI